MALAAAGAQQEGLGLVHAVMAEQQPGGAQFATGRQQCLKPRGAGAGLQAGAAGQTQGDNPDGDPLPCQHGGHACGLFGAFAAQAVFGDQRRQRHAVFLRPLAGEQRQRQGMRPAGDRHRHPPRRRAEAGHGRGEGFGRH